MYFLALSHAPPPLVMEMATKSPVTIVPSSTPPRAIGPRMKPTRMGESTGIAPGTIIFWIAAFVTISTQVPYSGLPVPSMIPLISRNWRRTSATTSPAATPTAFMHNEAKRYGSMPPRNSPTRTWGFDRSKLLETPCPRTSATFRANSANNTMAARAADPIA